MLKDKRIKFEFENYLALAPWGSGHKPLTKALELFFLNCRYFFHND